MRPGQDVAIYFAVIFLGLAVWREVIWFKRISAWEKAVGHVTGFRTGGDGPSGPIVGYSVEGHDKTFESSFCLSNPQVGSVVDVRYDPKSDDAVVLTGRHRWFLTGLCGALSFVMLGVAALSH